MLSNRCNRTGNNGSANTLRVSTEKEAASLSKKATSPWPTGHSITYNFCQHYWKNDCQAKNEKQHAITTKKTLSTYYCAKEPEQMRFGMSKRSKVKIWRESSHNNTNPTNQSWRGDKVNRVDSHECRRLRAETEYEKHCA